jgi:TP901 family phage tail tape measure protein
MAKEFTISAIFKVINKATPQLRTIGKTFDQIGMKAKAAGEAMTRAGKTMSVALTAPIAALGTLAIKTTADFQARMNMVGAVANATGEQFIQLESLAREMGATTQFSAVQAAEGMQFLGQAGLKTDDIMGALPRTLELAASAQLDLGTSADIVTNIMKGMQLETEELGRVNDVLVNAFTNANVNLQQLGHAFKFAGANAKGAGLDIETTAALIAKMGDAGIQGSMAGTALRGALLRLQNPSAKANKIMRRFGIKLRKFTKTDESGKKIFDLVGVLKEFEKRGLSAAEIAAIVGDRAGTGMAVLVQSGIDSVEEFAEALRKQGTAAKIAQAQMEGLPGTLKLLKSAWEAVMISIGKSDFGKMVNEWLGRLAAFLQGLSETNPGLVALGTSIAIVVAGLGPAIVALGFFISSLGTVASAISTVALALTAGTGLVFALSILLPMIAAVTVAWVAFGGTMDDVKAGFTSWIDGIKILINAFSERGLLGVVKLFFSATRDMLDEGLGEWFTFFMGLEGGLSKISEFIDDIKVGLGVLGRFADKIFGGGGEATFTPEREIGFGARQLAQRQAAATANIDGNVGVDVKVSSEEGSRALIEGVKTSGPLQTNIISEAYQGVQ